jgi:hypothetical protein
MRAVDQAAASRCPVEPSGLKEQRLPRVYQLGPLDDRRRADPRKSRFSGPPI